MTDEIGHNRFFSHGVGFSIFVFCIPPFICQIAYGLTNFNHLFQRRGMENKTQPIKFLSVFTSVNKCLSEKKVVCFICIEVAESQRTSNRDSGIEKLVKK